MVSSHYAQDDGTGVSDWNTLGIGAVVWTDVESDEVCVAMSRETVEKLVLAGLIAPAGCVRRSETNVKGSIRALRGVGSTQRRVRRLKAPVGDFWTAAYVVILAVPAAVIVMVMMDVLSGLFSRLSGM